MCGIAGYFIFKKIKEKWVPDLAKSNSLLKHRGPDDSGYYFSPTTPMGLTHTRLSILDISSAGHQPMLSKDKNTVIAFNGEIYNFKELRDFLDKNSDIKWESNTDTEVLLNLYIYIKQNDQTFDFFLKKLNGIFSIAIWDQSTQNLLLARDPFGVKPLYYFLNQNGIAFASEIKALIPLIPSLKSISRNSFGDLDLQAINRYLTFLWCPGDSTPIQTIKKLEPGYMASVSKDFNNDFHKWYFPSLFVSDRIKVKESKDEIISQTERLLRIAVHRQLISDAPLGSFLSGGLDSSSIVKLASEIVPGIPCFTIQLSSKSNDGFADDLPYAKIVAKHLNVPLEIVSINSDLLARSIERMILTLEEPLADPAALNVFYISQFAREQGIKVLLSGAGADDIFTGYRRHIAIKNEYLWKWIPSNLRSLTKQVSLGLPSNRTFLRRIKKALSGSHLDGINSLINYFRWIERNDLEKLYSKEFKHAVGDFETELPMVDYIKNFPADSDKISQVLSLEQRFFLTDHNLNYTDKMSMLAGVEVRVPFLDYELVDYVSGIPSKYKQKGNQGKWILKKIMEPYLPKQVIYRSKTGFGVPLRRWLCFELEDWLNETLSVNRLQSRGIFDPQEVQKLISQNKLGNVDATYTLFSLACVEIWCQYFL